MSKPRNVQARDLVGRKIVAVEFHPFKCRRHYNEWATQPVITLDNGRRLRFVVQETDYGEYGVALALSDKPAKSPPTI